MSVPNFIKIHSRVIEIFQSGSGWPTTRLTLPSQNPCCMQVWLKKTYKLLVKGMVITKIHVICSKWDKSYKNTAWYKIVLMEFLINTLCVLHLYILVPTICWLTVLQIDGLCCCTANWHISTCCFTVMHGFYEDIKTELQITYVVSFCGIICVFYRLLLLHDIMYTRAHFAISCCLGSHTVGWLLFLTEFPCGWNVENHYSICAEWFYCTQADVAFIMLCLIYL